MAQGMSAAPSLDGYDRLARLEQVLESLGHPVARVESRSGAHALLIDRGDARAAVVCGDISERDAAAEIGALRSLAPSRPLTVLALGPRPDLAARQRLRAAGVDLALDEAMDPHVLRFQINRALAPPDAPPRRATRAPIDLEVEIRTGFQRRLERVYTLSASGAYLLTDQPLRRGRRLTVDLPVGMLRPRARARVVLSNPAESPAHPGLPPGMAVAFSGLDGPAAAVFDRLVAERLAALAL